MTESRIKPCPFDGEEAEISFLKENRDHDDCWTVRCSGGDHAHICRDSESEAIAAWNRRAPSETVNAIEKKLAALTAAWETVRARVLCTIDPACAEHGFKEAMDAVHAMDDLRRGL